jgi:hypothetical protein
MGLIVEVGKSPITSSLKPITLAATFEGLPITPDTLPKLEQARFLAIQYHDAIF